MWPNILEVGKYIVRSNHIFASNDFCNAAQDQLCLHKFICFIDRQQVRYILNGSLVHNCTLPHYSALRENSPSQHQLDIMHKLVLQPLETNCNCLHGIMALVNCHDAAASLCGSKCAKRGVPVTKSGAGTGSICKAAHYERESHQQHDEGTGHYLG